AVRVRPHIVRGVPAMRYRVRLYAGTEGEEARRPAATIAVGDRRDRACWLPEPLAPAAHFFLEGVEARDEALAERIRAVLQPPSVPVTRSGQGAAGRLRTHGVYQAEEPYGTPAYWRAAIGRMPHAAEV